MKLYQVDAFTEQLFGGNPAAVCPLEHWLSDHLMQRIAMENNLSETAFFVRKGDVFHIRWFTPEMEIDLCGHATLASAHVIFNYLGYTKKEINFQYGGGNLNVTTSENVLHMGFPAVHSKRVDLTDDISRSLGKEPQELYMARDLMVIFKSEKDIQELEPNFARMSEIETLGIIATAPGDNVDFVSRFFAPRAGINEDPVTGSAHCMLIPYWAKRLNKNRLKALQLSNRLGKLSCEYLGERVMMAGNAVTYMIGEINI